VKGIKENLLRLLLLIVESPNRYTKKELALKLDCSEKTISNSFLELEKEGLTLGWDDRYRYHFEKSKVYDHLKELLLFTEDDRGLLSHTIDQIDKGKRGEKLKRKLSGLYDYKKLGHNFLRAPYLTKLDKLRKAEQGKKVVILHDYHSSNSNVLSNRKVEPFHTSAESDTLQAYDLDKGDLRHFRISRFSRISILDEQWKKQGKHNIRKTDPFRIVNNDQIQIHIKFDIAGKNELTERFPLTKNYIMETDKEGIFDFQCKVNRDFYGLTNFILGFHHRVIEIISPDELLEHLNNELKIMKNRFS